MKQLQLICFLLAFSTNIHAESLRRIDLQHRDAQSLAETLDALFEEDITIVVDANSLLVRGENADVQALVAMVQKMDKPQQAIRVSLYRGVDPYGGNSNEDNRRIKTTFAHSDNQLDQWIMDSGSTMLVRDNVRMLSQEKQLLLEADSQGQETFFKAESSEQSIQFKEHAITVTLVNAAQSARLAMKTEVVNRADSGADNELISTEIESRRVIPTGEWTRLFYRQNQANTFSPEKRVMATTALHFSDEQTLWIFIEPLSNQ